MKQIMRSLLTVVFVLLTHVYLAASTGYRDDPFVADALDSIRSLRKERSKQKSNLDPCTYQCDDGSIPSKLLEEEAETLRETQYLESVEEPCTLSMPLPFSQLPFHEALKGFPRLQSCCRNHLKCSRKCREIKKGCDDDFSTCAKNLCRPYHANGTLKGGASPTIYYGHNVQGRKLEKEMSQCELSVDLVVAMSKSSCGPFHRSQKENCVCSKL
eukprot:PhF_6_TR9703/c0_g1_i3/m.14930/K01047/PLA2G, SPLA2; secretory phospholipase A2